MIHRSKHFIGLVLIGLLLAGNNLQAQEIIPVTARPLSELLFHPVKKAPARVVSLQNSQLSSQLSALLRSVEVQVGQRVKKGQLLVILECDDYELRRDQLEAEKNPCRRICSLPATSTSVPENCCRPKVSLKNLTSNCWPICINSKPAYSYWTVKYNWQKKYKSLPDNCAV